MFVNSTYRSFSLFAMCTACFSVDLVANEQRVRSAPISFIPQVAALQEAHASPRTAAPALTAKKGTPPHRSPAAGAYAGLLSECAMYRYPAVPVKTPIAVELRVRRSLMSVSDDQFTCSADGQSSITRKLTI
jgi:hypothetical protein